MQCDNDKIGPHLSPSMFQAKSADDLFQWWVDVGPKNDDNNDDDGIKDNNHAEGGEEGGAGEEL